MHRYYYDKKVKWLDVKVKPNPAIYNGVSNCCLYFSICQHLYDYGETNMTPIYLMYLARYPKRFWGTYFDTILKEHMLSLRRLAEKLRLNVHLFYGRIITKNGVVCKQVSSEPDEVFNFGITSNIVRLFTDQHHFELICKDHNTKFGKGVPYVVDDYEEIIRLEKTNDKSDEQKNRLKLLINNIRLSDNEIIKGDGLLSGISLDTQSEFDDLLFYEE